MKKWPIYAIYFLPFHDYLEKDGAGQIVGWLFSSGGRPGEMVKLLIKNA